MTATLCRISAAFLALLAMGSAGFAQTKPLTPIKFSLDWKFEGPAAGFLFAAERGYFKAEGLDVTIDTGSGSTGAVTRVLVERLGLACHQYQPEALGGELTRKFKCRGQIETSLVCAV